MEKLFLCIFYKTGYLTDYVLFFTQVVAIIFVMDLFIERITHSKISESVLWVLQITVKRKK